MGYFQTVPGQVVGSAQMNAAINQGAIPFASAAARSAAISTPIAGMLTYLQDVRQLQMYSTSSPVGWIPVGGVVPRGLVHWGASSLATGTTRLVATPSSFTVAGGMTWDATGRYLVVPVTGWYRVEGQAIYASLTGPANAAAGDTSAANVYGNTLAGVTTGRADLTRSVYLNAGAWFAAWTSLTTGTASLNQFDLGLHWTGN